ncbi:tryptophan synthase, alpha chain [Desulfonatronum thiosulfatophilum]|uniref:Tryptophan synthase alpha chain n=1 Tax=Desulfonatronum thiosulfatophilum TaxID=617002 RepID=A0A1G6B155_9BACT|nr:tryptophan synthase subunit alpha [Desulfonatronum thiosulfatophilum]SDB14386.1 tryptophan synthase, alpha chain [Desulfonatronum thiosulfatophilum]
MSQNLLTQKIEQAKCQGRKAVMPYLPAGYPSRQDFWTHIRDLDAAGADIIEIGVPFSDPVADGPIVEQAALRCLEQGVSLEWILEELRRKRASINAGIVLMGYMNPFLQYGIPKLAREASVAGVNGLIIADLPFEESAEIREILQAQAIDLIPLVGLNSSSERLRMHAHEATGFVYFVSVMGTTGERAVLPPELRTALIQAKSIFSIPLALGFGLHSPSQLQGVEDAVDGVVIGSSLIRHITKTGQVGDFLTAWLN